MSLEKKSFTINSYERYCNTAFSSVCALEQPTEPQFRATEKVALLRLYSLADYSSAFTFILARESWDRDSTVAAIQLLNEAKESAEMDFVKLAYSQVDTSLDTVGKILIHQDQTVPEFRDMVILTVKIRISDSTTPIMVLREQEVDNPADLSFETFSN